VTGLATPIVEASPACRLLTPFAPIDEASGGMVLSVGGKAALDLLSSSAAGATSQSGSQPVVFAAIAEDPPDEEGVERFVVRPVRGIDPTRRGVMVGPDAKVGVRFAFAVRDGAAARTHLEGTARRVAKNALGSAPGFGIFLTCSGRGQGLYGAPDVESRILRQRFGDLPIAGMHAAFEIAPAGAGRAQMQLFTGVLALFRSPS
jgi:small ligand-binding sensory domain FIST